MPGSPNYPPSPSHPTAPSEEPVTADWAGEELNTFIVLVIENKQLTPGLLLSVPRGCRFRPLPVTRYTFPYSEIHPEHL